MRNSTLEPSGDPGVLWPRYRSLPLRIRIALIGLSLTLCIGLLGYASNTGQFSNLQFPWVAAAVSCATVTMLWYRASGTLDCIESELLRSAEHPVTLTDARRIVDANPVAVAWNGLVDSAAGVSQGTDPVRAVAALDDEMITMARAMRDLPTAWLITDLDGTIRIAGTAAAAIFASIDRRALEGKKLTELLGLTEQGADVASSGLDHLSNETEAAKEHRRHTLMRLLGTVRMVSLKHEAILAGRTVQLRIARSLLAGRSGDGEGMTWVIEDVTQQTLASKSRDQFLMTATHELRMPLGNLMAYAETLATNENLDVEQQKEFCNVLHSEASRLSRLVDHLLSVGQMEVGSLVIAQSEVDMSSVVRDAIENLRSAATSKLHTLDSEISPKLPPVRGDRDKLNAVVVNLIGNAIKYTAEGGKISVRASFDEESIWVEVQDSGLGISETELPKIFDQFFRGTNPRVIAETGNGLGLSFAREVARLHHGDIDVESRLGEGSIFTLRLPIGGISKSGLRPH